MTFEQERLKQARTAQGLSQRDVAALLEVSQPAYQKLETGQTTDMRISTLKRLCKVLKVSADWLLGLDDEISRTAEYVESKGLQNDAFTQEQLRKLGKK